MDRLAAPSQSQEMQPARPRRLEERVDAALPVILQAGGGGTTRDISASGVFFRTQEAMQEGDSIEFTIEFGDAGGERSYRMACRARVLRIERGDGSVGVAARIVDSKLALTGSGGTARHGMNQTTEAHK